MQYLGTNEIGFDKQALGFPSVKTCQAIVYETGSALYGFHDALGQSAAFPAKCSAFAQFVQEVSINHKWLAICVIGVITREQRFKMNQVDEWKAQLFEVAEHLDFQGEIWGARLQERVGDDDSAYIRFDRLDHTSGVKPPCQISFKTWSKMDLGDEFKNDDWRRRALKKDPSYNPSTMEEFYALPQITVPAPEPNRPVLRKGRLDEGKLNVLTELVRFR
ncbi:MAG: hypothetical protein ACREFP_23050 [Acetobacteraceae bacterium]